MFFLFFFYFHSSCYSVVQACTVNWLFCPPVFAAGWLPPMNGRFCPPNTVKTISPLIVCLLVPVPTVDGRFYPPNPIFPFLFFLPPPVMLPIFSLLFTFFLPLSLLLSLSLFFFSGFLASKSYFPLSLLPSTAHYAPPFSLSIFYVLLLSLSSSSSSDFWPPNCRFWFFLHSRPLIDHFGFFANV